MDNNKCHMVHWGQVCRSKSEGGLGVIDIGTFNEALMIKWWWFLPTNHVMAPDNQVRTA